MSGKRLSKKVRLTDVAAAAKVSQSTVSMALRDSEEIGAATREKIKRICASMGYVGPHVRTQEVRAASRRYGLLALQIHDNAYIESVLDGLTQGAVDRAGRVEVHVMSNTGDREKVLERSLTFAADLDGVILIGWAERYLLEALDAQSIPFVTVGAFHEDPNAIPARLNRAVMFNSTAMGRQATEHLLGQGHTRVGFVVEQMPRHMYNAGWYDGYRLACLNAGNRYDASHVYVGNGTGTADQVAHLVLKQKVRPTGYVISSASTAALFMRTLATHGVTLDKRDVVVCGDEHVLAEHKLTEHPAIVRSMRDLARAGMARLHETVVTGKVSYGVWMMPFEKRHFVAGE